MPDSILAFFHSTLGNSHLWGFLAAIPFIVAGFVGVLLPVLPGTVMIFCGFLLYGFITGFDGLQLSFFVGQLALVGLSYLVDFLATALGVRMYGGSKAAAWGAVLGSLLVFVIGPLGILVGPLVGAIGGELLMGEEIRQALHAGLGSFFGFVGGTLAKLLICAIMVAWFVVSIT